MVSVLVRCLDYLARFFYWTDHARFVRSGLFMTCVFVFVVMGMAQSARSEDTHIYPLPPAALRATIVNHYVSITGTLVYDGAYNVQSTILGIFGRSIRYIPFATIGTSQSVMVLDANLPAVTAKADQLTLIGRLVQGGKDQPEYYLQVMDPASLQIYDVLIVICLIFYAFVILGISLHWLFHRVDYVVTLPASLFDAENRHVDPSAPPLLLWFGSLGAAYGDIVLRQVPITFRAIPAEARLTPAQYPDLWSVIIKRLRLVQMTMVSTSYGAFPAVRFEFEDERGITRNGVVAANKNDLIRTILDVLRFVGQ